MKPKPIRRIIHPQDFINVEKIMKQFAKDLKKQGIDAQFGYIDGRIPTMEDK